MNLNYPTIVTDNFLPDPDLIRNFGLQQEFFMSSDNSWPGGRTDKLSSIAPWLDNMIMRAVLSQYYDISQDILIDVKVNSYFQLVSGTGDGWVHNDPSILTSILYLTPDLSTEYGTSIMRLKNANYNSEYDKSRKNSFKNNSVTEEEKEARNLHNSQFEEIVKVNNRYNRMVSFEGFQYHKGDGPSNHSEIPEQRLTLISFFYEMYSKDSPVDRIRKETYNTVIR